MGLIEEFEVNLWNKGHLVLGIDEAGRGPMAGPLVVSGVIFPQGFNHELIDDSKKLSEKRRNEVLRVIHDNALWTKTIIVSVQEIDASNIYKVTQDAMTAIANQAPSSFVLTDAMPLKESLKEHESVIKGDQRSLSIAAASILAKTLRDDIMIEIDKEYPHYGFKGHKGYGTKKHKEAILEFGRCEHHRITFRFKDES